MTAPLPVGSTITCVCKRCLREFAQLRIQGRPTEFCGALCKGDARREAAAKVARKRYQALIGAGVPPAEAQKASCSKWRFEAKMAEYAARSST